MIGWWCGKEYIDWKLSFVEREKKRDRDSERKKLLRIKNKWGKKSRGKNKWGKKGVGGKKSLTLLFPLASWYSTLISGEKNTSKA